MEKLIVANTYKSPMTDGYYDGYAVINNDDTRLLFLSALNASSSVRYVQVHDGYVEPTAGDVPVFSLKLAASSQEHVDFSNLSGLVTAIGLTIAVSSTAATYTAVTASSSDGAFLSVSWM